MRNLTCTCGNVPKQPKLHQNGICPKCGKEYYYVKALGKWMFTQRTHKIEGGKKS